MKVYTDPGNFQTLKLLVASHVSGEHLDVQQVSSEERVVPYLSTNKLPVLEVYPGKYLFSANTAARYLLLRQTNEENESTVDHWLDWESAVLLPAVYPYLLAAVGQMKLDSDIADSLQRCLKHLDTELKDKKFIVGDQLTAADLCVWSTVYPAVTGKLSFKDWESNFPCLKVWFNILSSQPAFQSAAEAVFSGKDNSALKASLVSQPVPLRPKEDGQKSHVKQQQQQKAKAKEEPAVAEKVIASPEEVASATEAWNSGLKSSPTPGARTHPVLPEKGRRNVLITSALPYVNNVPHLGNIIGCVLSADVFSRYCRLRNYNCLYICGTDEYGTATETKAIAEGLTPQQICDKYSAIHKQIYDWFNIDFDYFGRTTTVQQTSIAQEIFWRLHKRGHVLHDSIEQLHCQACDKFLADRFVEGTCPLCQYDDARGDQCDACGRLINAVELIKPKCKLCKSSPQIRSTDHLFLDLPRVEPMLQTHLDKVFQAGTWTNNARVITQSWIRDGLKPRCISRDLKWGTPVPLEGYTDKVFYVWFDAPIGYISITANYTDQWEQWWKNPNMVEYYNFLGKDNVPFHSVIFPATLLGAEDNYTIVKHMSATEYLNYEDGKFSKSRGTGVFGDQARDTGIPADIYRFYLLYVRPESQDSSFSWDDFLLKNNSELLNNLGNFINRALMFVNNNFGGSIQPMVLSADDQNLLALMTRELCTYIENMEEARLRDSIRNILNISRLGNQFMQENKPWVLVKGSDADKARAGSVVSLAANITCLLSVMLQPYMPQVSATIQSQLNAPASCNIVHNQFVCNLPPGHKIGTPAPLFQKIEASTIADLKKKFAGQAAPAANKAKAVKKGAESSPAVVADPELVERLTADITAQGNKVRDLKTAKAEKSAIDAEVAKLLDLKKQLTAAGGQVAPPAKSGGGNKKGGKKSANQSEHVKPEGGANGVNSEEIDRLTAAVAEQGNKVRDLKSAKAEKSVIDAEVAKLLDLKKQLTAAGGQVAPPAKSGGGNKKGGKKPANQSEPVKPEGGANGVISEEIDRLTAAAAEQGLKVRELKTSKADKDVVDSEVAKLLDLKKRLALALGLDPEVAVGGGKKKGKKK